MNLLMLAAAGIAGLLYAAACVYLWKEQRQLIFLPQAVVRRTPADVGVEFREVSIPVGERSAISTWWLPADSDQTTPRCCSTCAATTATLGRRWAALIKIGYLDRRVVFVHGTADDVVPPAMTERLYRAARGDKQLVLVKGAGHEEAMPAGGEPLMKAITDLGRACGRQ